MNDNNDDTNGANAQRAKAIAAAEEEVTATEDEQAEEHGPEQEPEPEPEPQPTTEDEQAEEHGPEQEPESEPEGESDSSGSSSESGDRDSPDKTEQEQGLWAKWTRNDRELDLKDTKEIWDPWGSGGLNRIAASVKQAGGYKHFAPAFWAFVGLVEVAYKFLVLKGLIPGRSPPDDVGASADEESGSE